MIFKSTNDKLEKYLGIDWGEKRIGLALADSETKLATPFLVVGTIEEILKIVKEEEIDLMVVGAPKKMSNSELRMSNDFLEFINLLKKKVKVPVVETDERLSSQAVDSLVGDKKTKAPKDAVAAMLILQSYLDRGTQIYE